MKVEPVFDVLYLLDITQKVDDLRYDELHVFSYLSCMLSLWRGHVLSDWNYTFILSSSPVPFAADIGSSTVWLVDQGLVEHDPMIGRVQITPLGSAKLNDIAHLGQISWRRKFHDVVAYLLGRFSINRAVLATLHDPLLQQMGRTHQRSDLLDPITVRLVREDFNQLVKVIGQTADQVPLESVSALWMQALLTILEDVKV